MRVYYFTLTRRELGEILGVKELHVRDAMRRYGIRKPWTKKYKQWTADEVEVIRLKYQTMTAADLSRELGISKSTLWGTVQRYGLTKRHRRSKNEINRNITMIAI